MRCAVQSSGAVRKPKKDDKNEYFSMSREWWMMRHFPSPHARGPFPASDSTCHSSITA